MHKRSANALMAMLYTAAARTELNYFGISLGKLPNRYKPHQGNQECARRRQQNGN